MPSLKDLKTRINSVKSTQKITKAMKMVAASKLRRAQDQAESARPYAERMEAVMGSLGAAVLKQPEAPKLLAGTGKDDVHLLVVCTAERGLCGAFNTNIAKKARTDAQKLVADGKTVKVMTVGRKGETLLKRWLGDGAIIHGTDLSHVKRLSFDDVRPITDRILALFDAGEFDVATLYYSTFKSVLTQEPTAQQLIPTALPDAVDAGEGGGAAAAYEYEPDEAEILADLLPRNLGIQIYRALLENAAGEEGARMTAMDAATRNAGEMIDKLTLTYNRTRQAYITKELIEIISGAEAL